jgi:hypothetical protein
LIDAQFDTIPDRLAPGGTGRYDTTLAAVRAVRDDYDPNAVDSVALITDGEDDDATGIQLPALLDTLRAGADPARPIRRWTPRTCSRCCSTRSAAAAE